MRSRAVSVVERLFALPFLLYDIVEGVAIAAKKLFRDARIAAHILLFPRVRGALFRDNRGWDKEIFVAFAEEVFALYLFFTRSEQQ